MESFVLKIYQIKCFWKWVDFINIKKRVLICLNFLFNELIGIGTDGCDEG